MWTIPFNRPSAIANEITYIKNAIEDGHLSGLGPYCIECESLLEAQTFSLKVLLTHSCTAALEMAAILSDLRPGDEVIMPSFTFSSTANAIVLRGAVPVFVDIDPKTLNISPRAVEAAINQKTKAIIAVHYAGIPADMGTLKAISESYNLTLIEDAAQALGSSYYGRACGNLGDIGAFSFHETKNTMSGEGGALTINRDDFIERAEIIRDKGTNRAQFVRGMISRYSWLDLGSSYMPSELVAAFLFAQLENAERVRLRRLNIVKAYQQGFACAVARSRIALPHLPDECEGNGHIFWMIMRDQSDRSRFTEHMAKEGIQITSHYVPLHSSPAGQRFGRHCGELAVTNHVADRLVRLPIYPGLEADLEKVIEHASSYLAA